MPQAVLGLGSNLGARRALFSCARTLLAGDGRLQLLASSPLYHTPPLGPPQPDYLNAALLVHWGGGAGELLAHCQQVELLLRRQRSERWGARTLDVDILHWSGGPISEGGLTVPHPGLLQRSFALGPLLDVLPALSAQLSPQLAALGGAPPHSEPFAPPVTRSAGALLTWCTDELPELVSAFGSALCASLDAPPPGDLGRSWEPPAASAVLAFECPDWPLQLTLAGVQQAVRAACGAGFGPQQLAVTDVSEGTLAGIMIGSENVARRSLPELSFLLENGPAGRWLRVWLQ